MSARKDRKGMTGTHAEHVVGLGGGAMPPQPSMPDFKASFKSCNIVTGESDYRGTRHEVNPGTQGTVKKSGRGRKY